MERTKIFLGISGSIRRGASSTLLLAWIGERLKTHNNFIEFTGLADIPAFDGAELSPAPVQELIDLIKTSDFVVICSPEHAHGVPATVNAISTAIEYIQLFNHG